MTIQSTIRLKPSQKLASKGKSVKYVLSLYNIGLIVFTSVGIRISLYQTEKLQLNSAMAQHQSTINELTGKLNDKENAALKKQITTKNSEIEKLSNNVKLLKNQ